MRRWVVVVVAVLLLAGCASEPTPQDLAEAQRVRQETADAAAAAAQQREVAAVEIEAAQRTLPARVARDALIQMAVGIAGALGLGILVVGGSLVLIEALRVRASTVYPNKAGQYPIVVRHSAVTGQTVVYDPARALGPVGIIQATGRIAARLAGSEPRVSLPVGTDHRTQAQITTQAQAAGLIVAATREGADPSGRAMTQPVVQGAFGGGALPPAVPDVVMLEAAQLPHIERLLGEPIEVDDD